MQDPTTPPLRLLLVEDDLVSRSFLQAVLESLPAQVDWAATAHEAQALAATHEHALWLIDVNLPDGRGSDLLASLRRRAADTPALAHTADLSPVLATQLRADGFADVLVKPLGRQALLDAVRTALPAARQASENLPTWDEQRALSALNGQQSHIKALRDLFMGELPSVRNAISQAMASEDAGQLRQQLHRLQASCGFVGAARLGAAAAQLQQQPHNHHARNNLNQAIQQLLGQ
ncbi:response regulator [Stenotrophomonas ginsengisoli]